MRIVVTGSAGFIGAAVVERLLARGEEVLGIDNHNNYYDPALKQARVDRFLEHPGYRHARLDLGDEKALDEVFHSFAPQRVVHLAAQASVRYSLQHPQSYLHSNLLGFGHVLECCRHAAVEHLVFASSSSVYGANRKLPYTESDAVDHPLSLYAASKKANELMAHSYSHLYGLPATGLRFFTVYGPWGRPDMSPILFARRILSGEPIQVFNYGHHRRDFTYIDDIVEGVIRVLDQPATADPDFDPVKPSLLTSSAPWRIFNIGNDQPVELLYFIELLERFLGRQAKKELLPMQAGDVKDTWADISALRQATGWAPSTAIEPGIERFVAWYLSYTKSCKEHITTL